MRTIHQIVALVAAAVMVEGCSAAEITPASGYGRNAVNSMQNKPILQPFTPAGKSLCPADIPCSTVTVIRGLSGPGGRRDVTTRSLTGPAATLGSEPAQFV